VLLWRCELIQMCTKLGVSQCGHNDSSSLKSFVRHVVGDLGVGGLQPAKVEGLEDAEVEGKLEVAERHPKCELPRHLTLRPGCKAFLEVRLQCAVDGDV